MPKAEYRPALTQEEREELEAIVTKGKHNAQKVLNALILLNCDEDVPSPRTNRILEESQSAIDPPHTV